MTEDKRTSVIWLPILSACVVILTLWFLFIDFKGLTHPQGMEQATVSRELARGNGFTTKSIPAFPLYLYQQNLKDQGNELNLDKFPETTHAPLLPILQSGWLSLFKDSWEVESTSIESTSNPAGTEETAASENKQEIQLGIYLPDRAIAILSALMFILALLVNGILISRLFSLKIAYFSLFSVITCSLFWDFIQTGLAQMLMLLLFSSALLFLQMALERSDREKSALLMVALAAMAFALLCLSHWLCLWIALGALLFVMTGLREKVASALIFVAIILPGPVWWMMTQSTNVGDPMGASFYSPLDQLNNTQLRESTEFLRSYQNQINQISPRDIPARVTILTSEQISNLFSYLGGVIAAPIFFLALLQPFQRASTAYLRWGLVLMWFFALAGMSLYGLHGQGAEANHLHLLFIPLMSAYGFSFVQSLWSKLDISDNVPLKQNLPLVVMIVASILPLTLTIARDIRFIGLERQLAVTDAGDFPVSVNAMRNLRAAVDKEEFVLSDIPWAVAWYGDRKALWIPTRREDIASLLNKLEEADEQCAGFCLSSETLDKSMLYNLFNPNSPDAAYNHLLLRLQLSIMAFENQQFSELGLEFNELNSLTHEQGRAALMLFRNSANTSAE